jgi:hypothetical protein
MKVLFFIFLIAVSLINAKLDRKRVVVAINCGGYTFTDSNGITYEKVYLKILIYLI